MDDPHDRLAQAVAKFAAPLVPAPNVLDALRRAARVRMVRKGEHLCREGDDATTLFFVSTGCCAIIIWPMARSIPGSSSTTGWS